MVSGNCSTSFCWTGWRVTDRSTGHGQSWTKVRSGQFLGAPDGAESGSPGPTVTTRSKPSHSLTPSRSYRGNADDPAVVLIACWATAVMMLRRSGKVCVADASSLFLRSGRPNTTADWAGGGGSWNEPSPSSISFAACAFATKSGRTFMRHSCL